VQPPAVPLRNGLLAGSALGDSPLRTPHSQWPHFCGCDAFMRQVEPTLNALSNIPSNIKEYQTGELQPLSAIPPPGDAGPSATSPFGSAGAEATDFSQFSVSALSRAMRLSISRGIAWKSPRSWRSFLPMVVAQSHSAIALPPKQTRQAAGECRPVDRVCGDLANKAKHTRWMALVSFPVAAKLWAARLSCLHACNLVKPLLMRCRSALRDKRRPASAAAIYPRCGHRTEPLTERRVASMR